MKKILWSWGLGLYAIFCIVEGIVNRSWIDLIFGLLLGGSGGAYAVTKSENRTGEDPSMPKSPAPLIDHPNSIKSKFSSLSKKQKIALAALIAVLVLGVTGVLNQKAANTAKAANSAQQVFLDSLKGKTPTEVNLIACKQADISLQTVFKGGSTGKSVGDAIDMFNRSAKDMTYISSYAVGPMKVTFSNMAATSREAALALDKDEAAQTAAAMALKAAQSDLAQGCKSIGY